MLCRRMAPAVLAALLPLSLAALASLGCSDSDTDVTPPAPVTVAVTGVVLDNNALRLTAGATASLTAVVTPSNATNRAVSWNSEPAGVLSVVPAGPGAANVTALHDGAARVVVTTADGGRTDSCRVVVEEGVVHVTDLALDRAALGLVPGGSGVLNAFLSPAGADNRGVSWASGNPGVATVAGTGATAMVTGVASGTTTVTAKTADGGYTAACTVTVAPYTVQIQNLLVNPAVLSIGRLTSSNLTASVHPPNAAATLAWTSTNTGVATVSGTGATGTVQALTAGNATITVSAGGLSASCELTVFNVYPTAVTLSPATQEITSRGSGTVTAALTPTNATERDLVWSSSNPAVANVVGNLTTATIVPVGTGQTTIRARASNGVEGSCTVTVANKPAIIGIMPHTTIAMGYENSHGLRSPGTNWGWGDNWFGQVGDGTDEDRDVPTQGGTINNWVSIAAGYASTAAIRADGSLWAWGYNGTGQLGIGDEEIDWMPTPTRVGTANNWAAVAIGDEHMMAIKTDGTLWATGRNDDGQLGLGDNVDRFTLTQVGVDRDWAVVACGMSHTAAIKDWGALYCWGLGSNGRLGTGNNTSQNAPVRIGTLETWKFVDCGDDHTLGIQTNNSGWAWGTGGYGRLGDGGTANRTAPVSISGNIQWKTLSGGYLLSAGVSTDGWLYTWGTNQLYVTGSGSNSGNTTAPARRGTAANWVDVSAGGYHGGALNSAGELWMWGDDEVGQQGNGPGETAGRTPTLLSSGWLLPTP